jgi:hypothetical protein
MRLVDCNTYFGVIAGRALDVSLATLLSDLERHRVAREHGRTRCAASTWPTKGIQLITDRSADRGYSTG